MTPFRCHFNCRKTFNTKDALGRHMTSKHKNYLRQRLDEETVFSDEIVDVENLTFNTDAIMEEVGLNNTEGKLSKTMTMGMMMGKFNT
ncbi:hypothetical protein HDU79_001101, partial [Rhizoclosmatium sp. JEL0117]